MEKSVTTQIRIYHNDGKWIEETVQVTVVGNKEEKITTTRQLSDPPSTDGHRRKSRSSSSSSSSSRSPSPRRAAKQKSGKKDAASSEGGLLSRIKSKARDSSTSDDDLDDYDKTFAKEVLAAVNEKRKIHEVKRLSRSRKLNQEARQWARHLAAMDKMDHKDDKEIGQNVFCLNANLPVQKSHVTGSQVVEHWYSQANKHKFGEEPGVGPLETGYFTQMVWKDSKELGVGIAINATKHNIYVVAFFTPKGNWKEEFATQVPPMGGFPKQSMMSSLTNKLRRASIGSNSSSSDEEEDKTRLKAHNVPPFKLSKQSGKKEAASSEGGLVSVIKSKARDSSTSDDDQDDYDKTFAKEVLAAVNEKRKIHEVKRLSRSRKLNQEARQWARHLAAMDKMDHKDDKEIGQNVFCLTANLPVQKSHVTGSQVVEQWYSQASKHKFGEEPGAGPLGTGYFTQMVWKDSRELGVGIAINATKHNIYVVAFFTPKGNWKEEFTTQVPPVGGFPKESMMSSLTNKLRRASIGSNSSSSDEEEDKTRLKAHNVPPFKLSKQSDKKDAASSEGGLLSRIKSKASDSSTSDDDQDDCDETFAKDVLAAVNEKRKIHEVKRLSMSRKLNREARQWAQHLAAMDKMDHKDDKEIGQNVYRLIANLPVQKSHVTGSEVVEQWYSHANKHKFGEEPAVGLLETGNFTQMVWKDSKEIGVGIAINVNKHNIYVVAFFTPKGNTTGEFATQVPPVGGFPKQSIMSNLTNKLRRASIGSNSSSSDEEGDKTVLKTNNQYTSKHDVPPPKLSKKSDKKDAASSEGGLLSRIKSKARDSSTSDDEQDDYDKTFAKEVLAAVNEKRKIHEVKRLSRSRKLNREARQWAQHLAAMDKMDHKDDEEIGQNVYRLIANLPVQKSHVTGSQVVDQWYSQANKHKFGEEPAFSPLETGNFTQLVWKDSKELGVGIAINASKRNIYMVAFFTPKGNWKGQFSIQVPPVGGFPKQSMMSNLTNKLRRASIGSNSSSSDEEEDKTVLKDHNQYKGKHDVPPPKLSKKSGKKDAASSEGGLLARIKSKTRDSSTSDDDQDDYDKTFAKDVRAAVNQKRKIHEVKRLSRSRKLNREARQWAQHLAAMDKMEHKDDKEIGQNVYRITANLPVQKSHVTGSQVVEQWYSQANKHKFGEEPGAGPLETGNFTQMVWKDSKEIGVGIAINTTKHNIYVVAFFSPKGNCGGQFATQVPPVGGFPKQSMMSSLTNKLRRASIGSHISSSDEEEDFNLAVLKAHNQFRSKHGVPPLKLSKKLDKAAKSWAKSIAKKDQMENNPSREYGENIYAKWSSNPKHKISGKEAVQSWYSEVKDHTYWEEPKPLTTGNFTQVVWEDSKELGVGLARNKGSSKVYVVCFYEPAGNVIGGFTKNVPPPKK